MKLPYPEVTSQTSHYWSLSVEQLQHALKTDCSVGLTADEAAQRCQRSGQLLGPSPFKQGLWLLLRQFKSPLVLILIIAVLLSTALQEYSNAFIILTIVVLSALMGFLQELKANKATQKLLNLVKIKATVIRDGHRLNITRGMVVSGDLIELKAGDIIPGDCRLLEAKDLHVNEASLTGESFPQEKEPGALSADTPLSKRTNCLFQGTSVISGSAKAIVVHIGSNTVFGGIASGANHEDAVSSFTVGIKRFGYLIMKVTLMLTLIVVTVNIYLGKPIVDSFLFGLALTLGMTPELLPAIVTITLAEGARRMAEKKAIVKKLEAIQNLGSINVLCADKTGTLTEGTIEVIDTLDVNGQPSNAVKRLAYMNACFESGFINPIDNALRGLRIDVTGYEKVDEVPYDFIRKRLSIVVSSGQQHTMITKGAVQNILDVCSKVEVNEATYSMADYREKIQQQHTHFCVEGFRTIAVACKDVTGDPVINKDDETEMTFMGFVLLSDPVKPHVHSTIQALTEAGVGIKVITGDNRLVAVHLSEQLGLSWGDMLTGPALSQMSDEALVQQVRTVNVFSETEPYQKQRIVRALRKAGYVVGYMGDGINDVSAMKAADVSISVDSAVDVAKESADVVLLEKDLGILRDGLLEGRKTFINTMKYIWITSSANLGNMVSMAFASLYLPFLPLLPKQILLTNFLTDLPAMMLPKDNVDAERVHKPIQWDVNRIRKFMIWFGLESSAFDVITFVVLLGVYKASSTTFQTSWFVESVVTEVLVLLLIRTARPVYQSKPGVALIVTSATVAIVTVLLPYVSLGKALGFEGLSFWIGMTMIVIALLYGVSAEITKRFFFRQTQPT